MNTSLLQVYSSPRAYRDYLFSVAGLMVREGGMTWSESRKPSGVENRSP